MPSKRRYTRAVYGPIDRRFPKRHPVIEAMYPGHFLPSSPQMLEELLRRNLKLVPKPLLLTDVIQVRAPPTLSRLALSIYVIGAPTLKAASTPSGVSYRLTLGMSGRLGCCWRRL
jgi:hypothetical protein